MSNAVTVTVKSTTSNLDLLYSIDGINFQTGYSLPGSNFFGLLATNQESLLFGGATGAGNTILLRTVDGSNWLNVASNIIPGDFPYRAAWNGSNWFMLVATSVDGNLRSSYGYISTNGIDWTIASNINLMSGTSMVSGTPGLFVSAVHTYLDVDADNFFMTSPDGTNWTPYVTPDPPFSPNADLILDVQYNGSIYLALVSKVFGEQVYSMTSSDLVTWELSSNITEVLDRGTCLRWNGNIWVAGGHRTNQKSQLAYSSNGSNWTAATSLDTLSPTNSFIFDVHWNGTMWYAVATVGPRGILQMYYSPDAVTWTESASNATYVSEGIEARGGQQFATYVSSFIPMSSYESSLASPVPSDPTEKAAYFALITNNFLSNSSSNAITVTSSNLVNYYRNIVQTIPVDSPIKFLPNIDGVVSYSVISGLSNGDYVIFPDNYTVSIDTYNIILTENYVMLSNAFTNTYGISNNTLLISTGGQTRTIASNGTFLPINGRVLKFLTASSPGLTQVVPYTYELAISSPIPQDVNNRADYFDGINNHLYNNSSSAALTISGSNILNFFYPILPDVNDKPIRFLPTNSSYQVSQSVITSLSHDDYVVFPDNSTIFIGSSSYATSNNSLIITTGGVPTTISQNEFSTISVDGSVTKQLLYYISPLLVIAKVIQTTYTYQSAVSNPVPSNSTDQLAYFQAIQSYLLSNSSTTAVTLNSSSSSNLVSYFRNIGANIPVNSIIRLLPVDDQGVVSPSVLSSLSVGQYVMIPQSISFSNTLYVNASSNSMSIVNEDASTNQIVENGIFIVNGKTFRYLRGNPSLLQIISTTTGFYTYDSALSTSVPSNSNSKADYFATVMNRYVNYSSYTGASVTVTNSNLVNYYRSIVPSIPLNSPIQFLPMNSIGQVEESVITSLSTGDYVIFPDNYTITIDGKSYATSNNNLIITTGGVPATIAPNESFTVYNKTIKFLTASSPALGEVTGTSSNTINLGAHVIVYAERTSANIPRPTRMLYSTGEIDFQDSGFFVGPSVKFIETNGSSILVSANDESEGIPTGIISRTTDGINWSNVLTLNQGEQAIAAAWNGRKWFMIAYVSSNDSYSGYASTNGVLWTQVAYSNAFRNMIVVRGIPDLFVGVRYRDANVMNSLIQTSSNGIDWIPNTSLDADIISVLPRDLQYNGSMWLASSYLNNDNSSLSLHTSSDLSTWITSTDIRSAAIHGIDSIGWNNNLWVIGGGGPGAQSINQVAYSSDGSNWTTASSLSTLMGNTSIIGRVIWNGSYWLASGIVTGDVSQSFYSSDAITWEAFPINSSNITNAITGNSYITSFYYPYTNSNVVDYTYASALASAVPSDSNLRIAYFAAIAANFSNNGSTTAVTVNSSNSSNLVNYYISLGANIPQNSSLRFLPNIGGVVGSSVITSLSVGDYVLFPNNTITIGSNTYSPGVNNSLLIANNGGSSNLLPNNTFVVNGKTFRFLMGNPALTLVIPTTTGLYTYESALSNAVPSDSNDKADYFAAITNNFSNYSSSTAVTVTNSNLVNYYRSQGSTIPIGGSVRFLPTNSTRVVSQAVITSLSNGDYIIFPDNYTIIIASKTYAISGSNLIITASGVPTTIAPNGTFTVYNKTIKFLTASSPGLGEVTGTASNPPCFLEGTKILCLVDETEQYITIESLTKGTLVKTKAGGYIPVTHLGYSLMSNSGLSTRERTQLYVCSPDKYPTLTDPLYITGCHSILVDEITEKQREEIVSIYGRVFETEVTYRLEAYLDERAEPWSEKGEFTVWHVALEHEKERWNWGIYANGLLVESISNHSILTSKTLSLIF